MNAELISIGDELLIGQVINTNAAYLAKGLNKLGISVVRIAVVSDKAQEIKNALQEAAARAQFVIITGGLGPTNDDVTKQTLSEYFNSNLVMHSDVLEKVKAFLHSRGVSVNEMNAMQALLPDNCEVLTNRSGTAQGMWFNREGVIYCALPGVPYEMKEIFEKEISPRILERFNLPFIQHKTILTSGIAESVMAQRIEHWEKQLPNHIKLAYLPSPGILRLRLSGKGSDPDKLKDEMRLEQEKLEDIIHSYIFGYNQDKLEEQIGRLLLKKGWSLALAESCTGGRISNMITSVPGASGYFKGSVVSYSNEVKINTLGVSSSTISQYGAVSQEVALEMARGALHALRSDVAVAVTGIAGPTGGNSLKPIGTTWIAVSSHNHTISQLYHFGEHRERNIQKASVAALFMLKKEIDSICE